MSRRDDPEAEARSLLRVVAAAPKRVEEAAEHAGAAAREAARLAADASMRATGILRKLAAGGLAASAAEAELGAAPTIGKPDGASRDGAEEATRFRHHRASAVAAAEAALAVAPQVVALWAARTAAEDEAAAQSTRISTP